MAFVLAALLDLLPRGASAARPTAPPPAGAPGSGKFTPLSAAPESDHALMRAYLAPSPARLGQSLTYHGGVLVRAGTSVTFDRPASGGDFSWGTAKAGHRGLGEGYHRDGYYLADSFWVEVPLQVFATGAVSVPGLGLTAKPRGRSDGRTVRAHLPTTHVLILPTVTPGDSTAKLRALHGPLKAPWWERVPWRWVIAGVLALVAIVLLAGWIRRKLRRKVVAPAAAAAPRVVRDPGAEALAALAALRAEQLPQQGRYGEHALALTRILRRFLEATVGTPRPGDSSSELLVRLRASALPADDVTRLEGLLGLWDRVKFARAPLGLEEAGRCELAVEALVRRREPPREVA